MQHLQTQNKVTQKLIERLQQLPTPLQYQVLDFVEFLLSRRLTPSSKSMLQPGTLTGLRGLLKNASVDLDAKAIKDDYVDYLLQKHQ